MTVPGYTDISHFRAPYKNSWPYTGISGLGQNGAPPALSPDQEAALAQYVLPGDDGSIAYRPQVAANLRKQLQGYRAIFLTDRTIKVEPYSPEELAAMEADPAARATLIAYGADRWIEDKLAEGMVIFASWGVLIPGLTEANLAAAPADEEETVQSTSHIAPILARPSMLSRLGSLSTAAIAVTAVVGGVLVYAVFGRKKRRRR